MLVVVDRDAHVTVSYVMNRTNPGLTGDDRGIGILLAASTSLSG